MKKKKQKALLPAKTVFFPTLTAMMAETTDPNGSYTGVPKDKYEKPVQDVDDL